MYATQKPAYKFPQDFIYFCRTDIDDFCVFVRRDSPFKDIKALVEAAKKTAAQRRAEPDSASGHHRHDGARRGHRRQVQLHPLRRRQPDLHRHAQRRDRGRRAADRQHRSRSTTSSGSSACSTTPTCSPPQTENAPPINAVFGTSIPELSSSRSWAVHTEWADANPEHFELLEKTAKEAHGSQEFRDAWVKTGKPIEALVWGDRKIAPNTPKA